MTLLLDYDAAMDVVNYLQATSSYPTLSKVKDGGRLNNEGVLFFWDPEEEIFSVLDNKGSYYFILVLLYNKDSIDPLKLKEHFEAWPSAAPIRGIHSSNCEFDRQHPEWDSLPILIFQQVFGSGTVIPIPAGSIVKSNGDEEQ